MRRLMFLLALTVLGACGDSTTAPSVQLAGTWDGQPRQGIIVHLVLTKPATNSQVDGTAAISVAGREPLMYEEVRATATSATTVRIEFRSLGLPGLPSTPAPITFTGILEPNRMRGTANGAVFFGDSLTLTKS